MPRWRPTRAGILNVWRYYDEVFEFHHGRMLLRGPNGSGKSKVLELLLPYVLDASLKPSRLSTFGGTERTMHWNLMGDGHTGTTRVGYVWLEFHHPGGDDDPPRWFGCGARLQATANTKNVTAAYFTTGLRIGVAGGLTLTGDAGQPLTRGQLIEAIGDAGTVHDSADSYRTTVRQTLYRGLSEQRYDSLLTALRQLRTPKLSERLDPGLLSQLLSSALPPLGEGEIHEIAEGFERLDRQREDLRLLDEHLQEAERLASRQRTYAQRVLRAGAAALNSATYVMEECAAKVKADRVEHDDACAARDEAGRRLSELEELGRTLSARIDGLVESDAYRAGRDLDTLRESAGKAERDASRSRDDAVRHARAAQVKRSQAEQARTVADGHRALAGRAEGEAARAAETAGFTAVHLEAVAAVGEAGGIEGEAAAEGGAGRSPVGASGAGSLGVRRARELLRAAVTSRETQIRELRTALTEHGTAVQRRTEAEQDRDESRGRLETATAKYLAARDVHTQEVGRLAADLGDWARACTQLAALDADELAAAAEDHDRADELVNSARAGAVERLAKAESELNGGLEDLTRHLGERMHERERLGRHSDLEPRAPHTRQADRSARPGAPLWRLVSFTDALDPAAQAGVEAALEAAGLLDAWMLPGGGLLSGERDAFVLAELSRPAPGRSLADVLAVETGSPVPADRVRSVLAGIAFGAAADETGHPAAVGTDGTWRLASATGRWSKPEPAFIGATARERARRRRIAELTEEIEALEEQVASCERALRNLDRDRATLGEELERRPRRQPVIDAAGALDRAEQEAGHCQEGLDRDQRRLRVREQAVAAALRTLTALGAGHGLPVSASALDRLEAAVRTAHTNAAGWLDHCEAARNAREHAATAARTAKDYEDVSEEAARRAAEAAETASELAEKLSAIDATIGVEHRQVLDRLHQARAELVRCRDGGRALTGDLRELEGRIGRLGAAVETAEAERVAAIRARDRAAERFRHLIGGHLGADARLSIDLPEDGGVRATLESARAVAAALDRVPHEPKNIRDAQARLSEAVHHAREVLAERADLELVADEDVQLLTATVNGVRIGAGRLSESLRHERDQRRDDITDKERDLFDRTLAGDTRRHLADRIRQASGLVDGMNRRLERVRTASRVAVHLVWQVDPQQSAGTRAARELLLRDPARLSETDREALYRFFRDRVEEARAANTAASWEQQLMEVLDYTAWHRFTVRLDRGDGRGWQDLTRKLHGALSGGEKAIALHLPLFAAVAAHYQTDLECPRFILLDEVFVGVDSTNRGQVFDLLVNLELDLVLTSDHEWCNYRELDGIAIHQLITGADGDGDDAVTTARFVWTGNALLSTGVEGDDDVPSGRPR
ncbi:TIGR02680 family protein [Actinomadura sp. HBU206391]|nr:TIGR02680 family protein [Actinomadura sp. HBU206391]